MNEKDIMTFLLNNWPSIVVTLALLRGYRLLRVHVFDRLDRLEARQQKNYDRLKLMKTLHLAHHPNDALQIMTEEERAAARTTNDSTP